MIKLGIEIQPPTKERRLINLILPGRLLGQILNRPLFPILGQITTTVTADDIVKVAQSDWARNAARGWVERYALTGAMTPEQLQQIERMIRIVYASGFLGVRDDALIRRAFRRLNELEPPVPTTPTARR